MTSEEVRVAVYRHFATTGRAPTVERIVTELSGTEDEVREMLLVLHDQRHLVLSNDGGVVMAHPFSSVPLGFSVMGARTLWWGGCAWDSFAIPHLVPDEPEVLVATTCPACGAPHAWVVGRDSPPVGDQRAHFLVPVERVWSDVVHSCANQRIFCDSRCVAAWLERTGNERGSEFDLSTLWRLARGWYEGRLDHGYERREPSEAASYFREVGLTGEFWGLLP